MPLPRNVDYTYGDLLKWPEEERYELYHGVPVLLAAPTPLHQTVCGEIFYQLRQFLEGKSCRPFMAPCDLRLFDTPSDVPEEAVLVLQPDVFVICDPSQITDKGIAGAPSLVVEVLSASTSERDRIEKYHLYERGGVKEYWIVDPEKGFLQAFRLVDGKYAAGEIFFPNTVVPSSSLEGFSLDLESVIS